MIIFLIWLMRAHNKKEAYPERQPPIDYLKYIYWMIIFSVITTCCLSFKTFTM